MPKTWYFCLFKPYNLSYTESMKFKLAALCLLVFTLQTAVYAQQNTQYGLNPQEHLNPAKIPAQQKTPLPLSVSYFIDETTEMPLEEVAKQTFKPTKSKFNPGFYKGILYIEVTFLPPKPEQGNEFVLHLGEEPLDFAELYIPDQNGNWKFLGRTGRMILKSQMTLQTWRLSIPFDAEDTASSRDSDGYEHLIIRTQAYIGSPVNITIEPSRYFLNKTHHMLMAQFLLLGFYIAIALFILFYGIRSKSMVAIIIGCGAVNLILLILQQKGFGPVYLWNSLSSLPHSPRLIYYLGALAFTLNFIGLDLFSAEHTSLSIPNKSIPILLIIMLVFFTACIIIQSPVIVYTIFTLFSLTMTAAASTGLIYILIHQKKSVPQTFIKTAVCWCIASTLLFFCQLFRYLRAFFDFFPFTLFDQDNFAVLDIVFLLITIPVGLNLITSLSKNIHHINAENKTLSHSQSLYRNVTRDLLDLSNVILNTIRLPIPQDKAVLEHTHVLIESAALHSTDILNAVAIVRDNTTPPAHPILIASFFKSCANAFNNYYQNKVQVFTFKTSVSNSKLVFANEGLLEFIIKNFMLSVVRNSPRVYPFDVQLTATDDTINCIIHTPNFINNEQTEQKTQNTELLEAAANIYKGTITSEQLSSGKRHTLSLKLNETEGNNINYPSVRTASSEEDVISRLNKTLKTEQKLESQDNQNSQKPNIFLAEQNIESRRLFENLLRSEANFTSVSNGSEAWNSLQSMTENPPDIIIIEYKLPFLNGDLLLEKCKSHPLIKTIPVIVLVDAQEARLKNFILKSGAAACITRPFHISEVSSTIHAIMNTTQMARESVISHLQTAMNVPSAQAEAPETHENDFGLSSREKEIALLIAEGKSDKEIAHTLNISAQTVSTHNKKIFKKLGVHSRVELMNKIR